MLYRVDRLVVRALVACSGVAQASADPLQTLQPHFTALTAPPSAADTALLSALWVAELGRCIDLSVPKLRSALQLPQSLWPAVTDTKAQPSAEQTPAAAEAVSELEVACAVALGACACGAETDPSFWQFIVSQVCVDTCLFFSSSN